MKTYLVCWPNSTITVVSAPNENKLYDTLDEEGDPEQAKIYILPTRFAVTTRIEDGKITAEETQSSKDLKQFQFS